jgi:lysophospholipase L1-like esterase
MSNIAMRGSSGTSFGAVDFKSMSYMHQDLNTRLIILQFGGNSIPHFKDSAGVRNYAYLFQKQIKYLQSSAPDAAIIVIGPSDMAQYKEGIFSSYEFIPYCIQEMKRQSLKAGASYWDLYHAMGGANSMFAWVENKLAGKDYVHFTTKGASTASQLFYDALISAYKEWEKKEKMTKQK